MQRKSLVRGALLPASMFSVVLSGCAAGSPPESEPLETDAPPAAEVLGSPDVEPTEPALREGPSSWREGMTSADPRVRAAAADLVTQADGDAGAQVLEHLALLDPEPMVREHAVLSYEGA